MSKKVGKMQMDEGRGEPEGRILMQCYRMREGMRVKRMRQERWTQEVNREKELLTTMTRLTPKCLVQL